MSEMMLKAKTAASKIVGEVEHLEHVRTLPTGEEVFAARCSDRDGNPEGVPKPSRDAPPPAKPSGSARKMPREVTITLNPNGLKAAVEWRSGQSGRNYKICDLESP